jgi:hypothetical protein
MLSDVAVESIALPTAMGRSDIPDPGKGVLRDAQPRVVLHVANRDHKSVGTSGVNGPLLIGGGLT